MSSERLTQSVTELLVQILLTPTSMEAQRLLADGALATVAQVRPHGTPGVAEGGR